MVTFEVSRDAAGQRLDKFVRRALEDVPLSHIYKMLRTRKVRVNGARGRAGQVLAEGDQVVIRGEEERWLYVKVPTRYLAIEASRDFLLAAAAGIAAALWLTRAPRAVAAFNAPTAPRAEPSPAPAPSAPAPDAPSPDAPPPADAS